MWEAEIDHSPIDVVAWHGNYTPYKYDLTKFNCINTVTYDHPDPSIYCVQAAPTAIPGTSNIELLSAPLDRRHRHFPPAAVSSQHRERVHGANTSANMKASFPAAPACTIACRGTGRDNEAYERGCKAEATPRYLDDTLAFLFETQLVVRPTRFALESEILERNYFEHWQSIKKLFQAPPADQPDPIGRRN